ncbi:MAG: PPC domain-containing protein [Gemmataceae bacterium]
MPPLRTLPLAALLLVPLVVQAQLPHARLDRITPLGAAAGSTVQVEIQGRDLDDATTLLFDRPSFTVERIKPNQFRVQVPGDLLPGTVEVRVAGKFGVSGSRLFAIQKGLVEVVEKEPNDSAATAQVVPLECVINGTCDGNGDDYFRFPVRQGQRVTIDCLALRLDSTLRATLVLSDTTGKELLRSRPYHQRTDPLLDFVAPATGDYLLQLHDMTYAGGLPYRLVISTRPYIETVSPLAIRPGEAPPLTLLGRNLPGGRPSATVPLLDRLLDELRLPAPTDKVDPLTFDFLVHATSASAKMRGRQFYPRGLENALRPATIVHADAPVTLEREPNDTPASAQLLKLPTVVSGRLDQPGDADWFTIELAAGDRVQVDLLCERLELPGDPYVLVTDEKGNEVAHLDDHGITFNALALYNRDPYGVFTAGAKGTYRLLVQDRYRQGGPRNGYVLRIHRVEPDFFPVVFHATVPDPTAPLVLAGGAAYAEVCLNRREFNGPVTIEAQGLPPGVSCPPLRLSPQADTGTLVFLASADAKPWEGPIRLRATGERDGKTLVRSVVPVQRRWAIDNINTSRISRDFYLAVRPGAPYLLRMQEKAEVLPGGTVEVLARVVRLGDFKGKVQLTGLNLPPGMSMPTTDIPEGKGEVPVKLTVAGNVPAGTFSVVVRGDAQVSYRRDPKEAPKNVRVADPSAPLLLTVLPAKK